MLEHLAEIAHVDPAVAGRALNELLGFALELFANGLSDGAKVMPSRCTTLTLLPQASWIG